MPDEPGRAASPAPAGGPKLCESPARLPPGERPASKFLGGSAEALRAAVPSPPGEPVRPSPVAASPSEPGLAAWRLSTAGGPEPAGASSGAGGLSRPDGLPPPEALGRPIQPLGWRRAWRRGGHRVRGQRRRNLSSADAGRQTMRNYPGLIDSVMTYSQNCVAANRPDDKSVENCICILHNLSYRLDSEVPNKYTQLNHMARNTYTDKTLTGCFNNRGGRVEYDEYDMPLPEEDYKPKGSSWLYHSDAIRTYLSLMDQSKKDATLEACAGALQNLTASRGLMSNGMSQLIALKEKGLPRIARLLQSNNAEVVRSGTSLLSNMSRHPILHKTMAHQVLPDVTRLLALQAPGSSNYGDIMSSACYTLRNLIMSNPQMAKPYLTGSLINNVVGLCRNGSYPKAAEAARLLLADLWSNRELQSMLKQQGYDKSMMGSLTGSTFRNLSSRF
uniref:Protein kinase pkp1 n=1 Tax=Sphaerodactylus townsendi TaxID=933632 RepID=A0ACB8F6C7_9SAUR